jgi:hypothetical protein
METSASLSSGRYVAILTAFPFFNTICSSVTRAVDNPVAVTMVEQWVKEFLPIGNFSSYAMHGLFRAIQARLSDESLLCQC